jgi:hypothetical protein
MSVLKLELKKEHIQLLSKLRWSLKDNTISGVGHDGEDFAPPFGGNNIYEEIDLILNGMPEDFDPFNTEEIKEYSDEQKAEWDKLYSELPTALDIILHNGNFDLGTYKTKYHDRLWKKIK